MDKIMKLEKHGLFNEMSSTFTVCLLERGFTYGIITLVRIRFLLT